MQQQLEKTTENFLEVYNQSFQQHRNSVYLSQNDLLNNFSV